MCSSDRLGVLKEETSKQMNATVAAHRPAPLPQTAGLTLRLQQHQNVA